MADDHTVDVDRLPTLTEVLELGRESAGESPVPAVNHAAPADPASQAADPAGSAGAPQTAFDSDPVAQVLALLEPRIGALLETRLREALAPALARAADGLIRDAQAELAPTLRGLVEEAVAQALRQPHSTK